MPEPFYKYEDIGKETEARIKRAQEYMSTLEQQRQQTRAKTQARVKAAEAYLKARQQPGAIEPQGWFQKYLTQPFARAGEWYHQKVLQPISAVVTAPWSPTVKEAIPGENWLQRELREYRAWEAPKYVKGISEFVADPLMALGGLGSVVGLGTKAGLVGVRTAAALRPAVAAERAALKVVTAPIELPVRGVVKAVRALRPESRVGEFLPTEDLVGIAFKPSKHRIAAQKAAKIPGMGKIIETIKYAATAETPVAQARVIRGQMEDTAQALTVGALAGAKAIRPTIKTVGAVVVDPAIAQIQKLPGDRVSMAFHDIVEYAPRYSMPQPVRNYINEIRTVSKDMSNLMRKEGILIQKKGESDWQYLHRVVASVKEDEVKILANDIASAITPEVGILPRLADESSWAYLARVSDALKRGELKASPNLDKLMDDAGKIIDIDRIKQKLDKKRFYETVADGLKAGVKYADDPLFELQNQLNMSYRMIIDKRIGEMFKTRIRTVTKDELIAAQMGVALKQTKTGKTIPLARTLSSDMRRAKWVDNILKWAMKGAKPAPATLAAVEKTFPEVGRRLRDTIKKIPADLDMLQRQVVDLQGRLAREIEAKARLKISVESDYGSARTIAFGADPAKRYIFEFKVVESEAPIASHTQAYGINLAYPKELQLRIRERLISRDQVERIARELDPDALLVDTHRLDSGALIMGADNVVESGSGRLMAIRKAISDYPERYTAYRAQLERTSAIYGIDPATVRSMRTPILVRQRVTKVADRIQFAREANESIAANMSPVELAFADASLIPDSILAHLRMEGMESLDEALRSAVNRDFIREVLSNLPQSDIGQFMTKEGFLSQEGLRRISGAILAKAFPGEVGLRLVTFTTEALDMPSKLIVAG